MPNSAGERNAILSSAGNQTPGHAAGHSADDGVMTDTFLQFDLQQEIAEAEQKKPWPSGIHARTLIKKHDFRVVLILMEPGAKMSEHHADGTISVQVLKGQIQFRSPETTQTLHAGSLLMLQASTKHDVEGTDNAAFLLTIGWPKSEELEAMPHRGYGS
ncbi:MAG TPA: cupin domain-containing protein [Candidatus Angelobacter sp.]|nr:cupin domain-containing protein [Candidatus Angelobacter sp.]